MTIVDITQTELMMLPLEVRKRILERAACDAEEDGCYELHEAQRDVHYVDRPKTES